MADILEILVAWDAGEGPSAISARLGYSRPTVRKYIQAARALGLTYGAQRRSEAVWTVATQQVMAQVAKQRVPGTVTAAVATHHAYLERHVGQVHLRSLLKNLFQGSNHVDSGTQRTRQ